MLKIKIQQYFHSLNLFFSLKRYGSYKHCNVHIIFDWFLLIIDYILQEWHPTEEELMKVFHKVNTEINIKCSDTTEIKLIFLPN